MTAVEWLWNALLVSGFEEIKNVEGFYHLAKQKEKEQIIDAADWNITELQLHDGEYYYNETFKTK